jgi:hypothetical protein
MDAKKAQYVIRYYGQLMTTPERLAHRHLMGTAKATHGRTDAVAQREAENSSHPARELLSNDPGALQLASDGIDAFVARTAQRILDEHSNEVAFNYCPCCGALAKTPKARQCSVCRHDWHSAAWTTQRCCQLLVSRLTGNLGTGTHLVRFPRLSGASVGSASPCSNDKRQLAASGVLHFLATSRTKRICNRRS